MDASSSQSVSDTDSIFHTSPRAFHFPKREFGKKSAVRRSFQTNIITCSSIIHWPHHFIIASVAAACVSVWRARERTSCAFARAPHRHTHATHTVEVSQECCFLTPHNGFCSHLRGKRPARHLRPFCFHCCPGRLSRAPSRDTRTGKMAVLF